MVAEILTKDQQVKLGNVVQEAAGDIAEFGWAAGGSIAFNPYHTDPRCVWIATSIAAQRAKTSTVFELDALEAALLTAAGVDNLSQLFDLNDSQSEEEGQAWAFGVLISASHILNPALAIGESKMDSNSTEETDTGSTGNVGSRLLSFLKRFIWVR
jgi:hypothetical protein